MRRGYVPWTPGGGPRLLLPERSPEQHRRGFRHHENVRFRLSVADGAGETPYGVVTGKEAWTFEWFPPSSDVFELRARVVDTAEMKSTPDEAITIDATLLGAMVTGPVALSGPIIADQTWTGEIELTGDVIVEVTQQEVKSPTDVTDRVDEVKKSGRKSVLLLISDSKGDLRFVAVPVGG